MRNQNNVFHLAIPTHDLDVAYDFYVSQLGCKLARRYDDRITIDFFGDQIVCHLNPNKCWPDDVEMYPFHAGITFSEKADFDNLVNLCLLRKLEFFVKPFDRFSGTPEMHSSFFLKDPSNNLLEFKYYKDNRMMY